MPRKRKINRDLPRNVYRKHGAYYFVDKDKKWIRLGVTKSKMYKTLALLEVKPEGGYTIRTLWSDFKEDRFNKISVVTQTTYTNSSKKILETFGHMALDEIKPSDISKYLLIRGKTTEASANLEIALLSAMYTYAVSLGHSERNPCLRVKRHKLPPRTRYVETFELNEFQSICDEQIDCYLELKYITALTQVQ